MSFSFMVSSLELDVSDACHPANVKAMKPAYREIREADSLLPLFHTKDGLEENRGRRMDESSHVFVET